MAQIPQSKLEVVKRLYYIKKYSMKFIAQKLGVSLNSVTYFMRRNELPRRTFKEEQKMRFENRIPSFRIRKHNKYTDELGAIGAMLYWGEGYKGREERPANLVDFTNSDPEMISLFMKFLRNNYELDTSKLRVLLYCYSDQQISSLIDFWSDLTGISKMSFSKPYIRNDHKKGSNKMRYGVVHIRYYDKKLLLEIKKLIDSYKVKYIK